MDFTKDFDKLQTISRHNYMKVYNELGNQMFSNCIIPTVADFLAIADNDNKQKAKNKISSISSFTGNEKDIVESCKKTSAVYTNEESNKFINTVIASNITDITQSGYFYKKLISSCDNMLIDLHSVDCGSTGQVISLPIDESTYNYKIKGHFIMELDDYTNNFKTFSSKTKNLSEIHVRNFLTCNHSKDHRTFCPRCAGIYSKYKGNKFIPKYIGLYATLMITEHATQASLDSMNKGRSEKINSILEQKLEKYYNTYDDVKKVINEIIDNIGNVGVDSRFYEIALLSRFYLQKDKSYEAAPLITSFLRQGDELGSFIYRPNKHTFNKLITADKINASSLKSQIALDTYE